MSHCTCNTVTPNPTRTKWCPHVFYLGVWLWIFLVVASVRGSWLMNRRFTLFDFWFLTSHRNKCPTLFALIHMQGWEPIRQHSQWSKHSGAYSRFIFFAWWFIWCWLQFMCVVLSRQRTWKRPAIESRTPTCPSLEEPDVVWKPGTFLVFSWYFWDITNLR